MPERTRTRQWLRSSNSSMDPDVLAAVQQHSPVDPDVPAAVKQQPSSDKRVDPNAPAAILIPKCLKRVSFSRQLGLGVRLASLTLNQDDDLKSCFLQARLPDVCTPLETMA